jgi:hypothetical protein
MCIVTLLAAAPEWAEATGLLQDAAASSTNGSSSSSGIQDPARSIPTMSWQQLQQLLQDQQPQQLVVLQVATGEDKAPARYAVVVIQTCSCPECVYFICHSAVGCVAAIVTLSGMKAAAAVSGGGYVR